MPGRQNEVVSYLNSAVGFLKAFFCRAVILGMSTIVTKNLM